ncbi:hypothetical protein K3169_04995 [Pseudomonas phytophila]|uniref:Uncharacterized protein n=1 Tax=Pseudomonas phytophila TaxID=2867264 RepID=A0ABY6FH55_9PSED|nr:hypothetical protein [Pseudomonas phytophila]UXZ97262.1 hypothetical protein K3169_04995 [Pseudomonas phytophila]
MPADHPAPFTYGGVQYHFDHLEPMTMKLTLAQGVVIYAEIRYKTHCYTRELDPGELAADLVRHDDQYGNERYFCPVRYALSHQLFNWIGAWCYQLCIYQPKHGENYIIVETSAGQSVKVAFSIEKHDHIPTGLMIWIKTTHPYNKSTPVKATRSNSFPFNTLAKSMAHKGTRPNKK